MNNAWMMNNLQSPVAFSVCYSLLLFLLLFLFLFRARLRAPKCKRKLVNSLLSVAAT